MHYLIKFLRDLAWSIADLYLGLRVLDSKKEKWRNVLRLMIASALMITYFVYNNEKWKE